MDYREMNAGMQCLEQHIACGRPRKATRAVLCDASTRTGSCSRLWMARTAIACSPRLTTRCALTQVTKQYASFVFNKDRRYDA